jgi:glycerol-3-phosphate dehydrogenase (NAD(P)+)
MQEMRPFLLAHDRMLRGKTLIACCKGIDLGTGQGPHEILGSCAPGSRPALLSGPSFAADIAAGLPTALTLATRSDTEGADLQEALSVPTLRLYRSEDMAGVALGGALKNVVAIACGVAMGAGLGESARAALMTRGYAEMVRFALAHGSRAETLSGLSGLGDLALTCTSEKSRNYRFGLSVGRDGASVPTETTEGIATARALARRAAPDEMPITSMVAALLDGAITVKTATATLLSRPLRAE